MTDPERLSKSPANSLAALLLQAAATEKPSAGVLSCASEAVAAAAVAAGVAKSAGSAAAAWGVKHAAGNAASTSVLAGGTSVLASGSTGLTGATIGIGAVAKWIAIGALGGAAALSSVQTLIAEQGTGHAQPTIAVATNAAVSSPSQQPSLAARTAPELVVSADPKERKPTIAIEAARAHSAEPALGDLAKPEAATLARTDSVFLAAEVRFVDQGRAALQRGAFAEALEQLTPYEGLFPHQQLLTEVLFLRMEAFSRLGNVDRARALAARLLTLGVVGRQAAQAREVLAP